MKSLLEKYLEDRDERRCFEQERAILAATETVFRLLEEQGLTQAALADRLGCSPSNVSQILDGENNFTVRTLADVLFVLDYRLNVSAEPLPSTVCAVDWPFIAGIGTDFRPQRGTVTFTAADVPAEPYRGVSRERLAA